MADLQSNLNQVLQRYDVELIKGGNSENDSQELVEKSKNVLAELQHLAETRSGTFPQITFSSELAPMEIQVPDFETQSKIVEILDLLEEKGENNEATNDNLA